MPPLNPPGLVTAFMLGTRNGLPRDEAMRAAMPAAVIPNLALGLAVSDLLIQQQQANEPPPTSGGVVLGPAIAGVSPNAGPTAGGTDVTITGSGLEGATDVNFGAAAATGVTVNPDGSVTATSPPGTASSVDVTVTTPAGTSAGVPADQFTFMAPPTVSAITPAGGPQAGQTPVTISGTDLAGATDVTFGSTPASSVEAVDNETIIAISPPQGGMTATVNVIVTAPGGRSQASGTDVFTYVPAPAVTSLKPNTGDGGEQVNITGTDLAGASDVKFGQASAAKLIPGTATQIGAVSPADQNAGTVDVTVTTPGGTSAVVDGDKFTFTGNNTPAIVPPVRLVQAASGHYKPGDVIEVGPEPWQGVGPHHPPRFQWFRDGVELERDGRSARYRVKAADEGCTLRVQMLYGDERSGYVSTLSNAIAIPKAPKRRPDKAAVVVEEEVILEAD